MRAGCGSRDKQRGAFLAIMVILMVVLLGVAALTLDLGRVLILRAQMQNAVDAAALAAAAQLNGESGARVRAMVAARHALRHSSGFSRVRDLLGEATLPDDAFSFFCIIGSRFDPDPNDADITAFCGHDATGSGRDSKKIAALTDARTHYVRVALRPDIGDADHFTVDLIFLPILRLLGVDEAVNNVVLRAEALAGRSFFMCNFPPLAICDPFENDGGFFNTMVVGGHVVVKSQQPGSQWSPGNFGFLELYGKGGKSLAQAMADEGDLGCSPPVITTQTGGVTGPVKSGINTRFGIYHRTQDDHYGAASGQDFGAIMGGFQNSQDTYPPAPNVASYPLDQTTLPADDRLGSGDWDCQAYWDDRYQGMSPAPPYPGGCLAGSLTRRDVYRHELEQGLALVDEHHDPVRSVPERRRLHVAVISCQAAGLTGGKKTAVLFNPDGFAEFFLLSPATPPPSAEIYLEYLGETDETEADFHVDVQLYE